MLHGRSKNISLSHGKQVLWVTGDSSKGEVLHEWSPPCETQFLRVTCAQKHFVKLLFVNKFQLAHVTSKPLHLYGKASGDFCQLRFRDVWLQNIRSSESTVRLAAECEITSSKQLRSLMEAVY